MPNDIAFRDYQLDALAAIFRDFGVTPAGPADDEIVASCSGNGPRQDCDHGRASEELADWSSDDDQSPF